MKEELLKTVDLPWSDSEIEVQLDDFDEDNLSFGSMMPTVYSAFHYLDLID